MAAIRLVKRATDRLRSVVVRQEGQGMAEYALILSGVGLTAIVAVNMLGVKIGALLNRIGASLS